MSAPRALLRNSRILSRNCTITRATRPACLSQAITPSRKLVTSSRLRQETVETPSRGQEVPLTASTPKPSGSHARSVAILRLPKRATPSEVETFIKNNGLEITNIQLRLDRFTFQNDSRCFVEFSSEEQARKAVEVLNDAKFKDGNIIVNPMKEDFVWESRSVEERAARYFNIQEVMPSEALKPLLEGRRKMFSVMPPGWGEPNSSVGHNKIAREHMHNHLGKFGIEAFSDLAPFHGDKKPHPRLLCFIDFTTKSGADQAVQAIHDTDIEGRKVWLQECHLSPWRADQVGKVDQTLLAKLQEKGLASTEPYEDNFVNSDRKKGAKFYRLTRFRRNEVIRAEKSKAGRDA